MAAVFFWVFLVLGALAITGIASRILLWLTKRVMGDTYQSIWLSHAVAYAAAVAVIANRRADGGSPPYGQMALTYALPILFWVWLSASALKKRRAGYGVFD